jgi:hypothetical protein
LSVRCLWLLSKATRHAVRSDPLAVDSLQQLFDISGGGEAADLTVDMLLFPNGGLGRYLSTRGPLLPADEADCARRWVEQRMRLLEVRSIGEDGTLETVDVAGGEELRIVDTSVSGSVEPGQALLARPLPVDDVWLFTPAVILVPDAARDRALEVLEGDVRPFELLTLLVDLQVATIRG